LLAESFDLVMENFLLKDMAQCIRQHFPGGTWPPCVIAFISEWKARPPTAYFLRTATSLPPALVPKVFFGSNINQRAKETRKDINNVCNPSYPELKTLPSGKQEPWVLKEIRQKLFDQNKKDNVKAAMTQCMKKSKVEVCSDGSTPKYTEDQLKEKVSTMSCSFSCIVDKQLFHCL